MAYGLVKRLKKSGRLVVLLSQLAAGVQPREEEKGKLHQVFRLSFDARLCHDEEMLEQKLEYIHHNPVSGKWSLVKDYALYQHSSAGYYDQADDNKYITHYKEVNSHSPP